MDRNTTILVVDDEEMLRDAVSSYLEKKGLQVLTAATGREALSLLESKPVDFLILDLMLPDFSGEEICSRIRQTSRIPIIMLTAKTTEEDMLNGLHLGADDYMTKPFSLKELYARIGAVCRRTAGEEKPLAERFQWNGGDLEVDLEHRTLYKQKTAVALTPIEWSILSAFLEHPKKIFTRNDLISTALDEDFDGYDRVIDTHIKNLRKKIEDDPKKPVYIRTVHGVGYKFGGERF